MTVAMLPLLHNTVPGLGMSHIFRPVYPTIAYQNFRNKINDPFVFNWLSETRFYTGKTRSWAAFQLQNNPGATQDCRGADLRVRPVDKRIIISNDA